MAQSTPLAAGTTTATSSDIIIAPGGSAVTVGLYVASGSLPGIVNLSLFMATPGAELEIAVLSKENPTWVLTGPGTYRVKRNSLSGVGVGVFAES